MRQVPAPSAAAWILDLTASRGPLLVILRRDARDCVETAVAFLVEADIVTDETEARELVAQADLQPAGIIW